MTRLFALLVAALLTLGLPLSGCGGPHAGHGADPGADATRYTCSMHPQVVQDGPGSCPICGMDLTPMAATPAAAPQGVTVRPGMVQQIGVETQPVARTTVFRHLRTIGEVEVGEDELSVVNLRLSGWAERVRVETTGAEVRAGQILFDLYSPELVAAQEELLLARRTQGAGSPLATSSRRRLALYGVAERDIAALEARGAVARTVPVRAPASGFVLHKDLVQGARVEAGRDLYRIGDLQRIWVKAEIYEHDVPWIEEGQAAQMELTHLGGAVLEGAVAYVYPTLDPQSRTLTVRLEFDNPGVQLKPGMFATVHIQYRRKDDVLAVPSEAILHSGSRRLVFLARGGGRFEPREVTTGLQGDHRMVEVVSGLAEGDEVVTSGQFLLDSESQLQEALDKMMAGEGVTEAGHDHPTTLWSCPMHPEVLSADAGRCPECGMDLEQRPGSTAELAQVYDTVAQPGDYTCPMHPRVVQEGPGRCPQCGMFLEQVPGEAEDPADAPPQAAYACPMHLQVTADEPGACVICGMDLAPTAADPAPGGRP